MEMIIALERLTDKEMMNLFTRGTLNFTAELTEEENPPHIANNKYFESSTVDVTVTYGDCEINVELRSLIDVEDNGGLSEKFHDDFYDVIDDIVSWINDGMENDNGDNDDNDIDSDDNDSDDNDNNNNYRHDAVGLFVAGGPLPLAPPTTGGPPQWPVPSLAPRCITILRTGAQCARNVAANCHPHCGKNMHFPNGTDGQTRCPVVVASGEVCGRLAVATNYYPHCEKNMHFPNGTDGRMRCPVVLASGDVCGKLAGIGPEYQLSGYCGKYGHKPFMIASPLSTNARAIILVGHSHFVPARLNLPHGRTVIQYTDVGNFIKRSDVSLFLAAMNSSNNILLHAGDVTNQAKIVQDVHHDHAVSGDGDSDQRPQCGVYLWERRNPAVNQISLVRMLRNAGESFTISQAFTAYPHIHCLIFLGCRGVTDQSLCEQMKKVTI